MNALQPATTANQTPGVKAAAGFGRISFRLTPYLFLLPTLGMLTAFSLIPLLYGLWMSLHNIDILHGKSEFIGLQNYFNLLHDPKFGLSLVNTGGFTLAVGSSFVVFSLSTCLFLLLPTLARLVDLGGFFVPFL